MSLTDSHYVPMVAYVLAIHGSPFWYGTTTAGDLEDKFPDLQGDGGQLVGGLTARPDISQTLDPMGGIADVGGITFEVIDDYQEKRLPRFFRAGVSGLRLQYLSETLGRDTTALYLADNSGVYAGEWIFLPRETVKVVSTGADGLVTVTRSQYSAFGATRWAEQFRVVGEVAQGAAAISFGGSDGLNGGHFKHGDRWVCLYRVVSSRTGTWGTPDRVWAGVIEEVHQQGGRWSIACKSITQILEREIGVPIWESYIQEGYWLSGEATDSYALQARKTGVGVFDVVRVAGSKWGLSGADLLGSTAEPDACTAKWSVYPSVNAQGADAIQETLQVIEYSQLRKALGAEIQGYEQGGVLWFTPLSTRGASTFIPINGLFQVDPLNRPPGIVNQGIYWFALESAKMGSVVYVGTKYEATEDAFRAYQWVDKDIKNISDAMAWGDRITSSLVFIGKQRELFTTILQIMTSTGEENYNGDYDTLIASAGLAIPECLIDVASLETMAGTWNTSGTVALLEAKGFKAYITDDLKTFGVAIRWIDGQLSALGDLVPMSATVVEDLTPSNCITREPNSAKGYIAPLESIEIEYAQDSRKMIWNMRDSSATAATGNAMKLSPHFLQDLPDELHARQWSRLLWLCQDSQRIQIDVGRSLWETVHPGDTVTITHPLIQDNAGQGYGCTEAVALVVEKTDGDVSSLSAVVRTTVDPSGLVIFAPSLEVDLDYAGTVRGYDSASGKVYLLNTFAPWETEDGAWWYSFYSTTFFVLRWWDTQGNEGILDAPATLRAALPYMNFAGTTPGWTVTSGKRVFLTVVDYGD